MKARPFVFFIRRKFDRDVSGAAAVVIPRRGEKRGMMRDDFFFVDGVENKMERARGIEPP